VITPGADQYIEACSVIAGLSSYSETSVAITGQEATYNVSVVEECIYSISYVDETVGSCPWVVTRTFTATDDCGNVGTATQKFTIDDTTAPVVTVPATSLTMECFDASLVANWAATASASDNCDGAVTVVPTYALPAGACNQSIVVTFTATDNCGNTTVETKSFTVNDTTAPTFNESLPGNTTVECDAVPAAVTLTADDNCDTDVPVVYSESRTNGSCPDSYTLTRTWTATDDCGNSTQHIQTIQVQDTTPPVIGTAASDQTVECDGTSDPSGALAAWLASHGGAAAADNCGDVAWSHNFSSLSDLCGATGTATVIFTATDDCGNSSTTTATFTIQDTTPPVITGGSNGSGECEGTDPSLNSSYLNWKSSFAGVAASDNCGTASLSVSEGGWTQPDACTDQITVSIIATDACGLTASRSFTFTITDNIAPVITVPVVALNMECFDAATVSAWAATASALDACDGVVSVSPSYSPPATSCNQTVTVTFTATDACGNTATATKDFTVNDTTAPTASNPAAVTVQCIGDVPVADVSVVTDEADNCTASPVVAFVSDVSDGNSCPEVITRTYSVTDNCGNAITVTQTITVDDTTAPTASNPAPVTVECVGDVPAPNVNVVTDEADNCTANPVVTFVSDVSDGNSCPEVITRTYSVTDNCGNSITVTQLITIGDTTDPTISCPVPQTVPADYEKLFGTVNLAAPVIADNCTATGDLTLTWSMTGATTANGTGVIPSPYQFNIGTTTVTYTVADACNNTASCSFVITITAKPVITCAPDISDVADLDKCSKDLDPGHPTLVEGAVPITWTWTIRDEGGNVVSSGSEVRNDTTVPDISPIPYSFPVGVTTITWRAENLSGYDECTQTITIVDDQAPVLAQPEPFEDCVLRVITAAYYDAGVGLVADRREYYLFEVGDLDLDLDPSLFDDNCNQGCTYEVHWRINFADGTMLPADGTYIVGQPSTYDEDIQFPGDGVNYTNVVHHITYWIVDCEGNPSLPQETTITITPRPRIEKIE